MVFDLFMYRYIVLTKSHTLVYITYTCTEENHVPVSVAVFVVREEPGSGGGGGGMGRDGGGRAGRTEAVGR